MELEAQPLTAASIDIGSNTIRLLAVRIEPSGAITRLADEGVFARLGDGLAEGGCLAPQSRAKALEAVAAYTAKARDLGVSLIIAFATEAIRRARDGNEFAREVERTTGVALRVLSGQEEARLSYLGASHGGSAGGPVVVLDIGGGSTEFALGRGGRSEGHTSCPIGSRWLLDHLGWGAGPVNEAELAHAASVVAQRLAPHVAAVRSRQAAALVGVGGTVTALAAADLGLTQYDQPRIQDHVLAERSVRRLLAELAALDTPDRAKYPGISTERADVIVPGTVILVTAMELLEASELRVDTNGVRLGVILEEL